MICFAISGDLLSLRMFAAIINWANDRLRRVRGSIRSMTGFTMANPGKDGNILVRASADRRRSTAIEGHRHGIGMPSLAVVGVPRPIQSGRCRPASR
jgi:hypothetical protein